MKSLLWWAIYYICAIAGSYDRRLRVVRGKNAQKFANYMWVYWHKGDWGPAYNCAAYARKYGVGYVDNLSMKLALAIMER